MLRLDPTNARRTIELVAGVSVTVVPLTSAIWALAGNEAGKTLPQALAPEEVTVAVVKAVARRTIVDWDGIGDLDGNPVAPSPEWIDLLMDQYQVYDAFNQKFVGPYILMSAEGNASASSRIGNSEEAKTTAPAVAKSAQSVPSSNTRRKR